MKNVNIESYSKNIEFSIKVNSLYGEYKRRFKKIEILAFLNRIPTNVFNSRMESYVDRLLEAEKSGGSASDIIDEDYSKTYHEIFHDISFAKDKFASIFTIVSRMFLSLAIFVVFFSLVFGSWFKMYITNAYKFGFYPLYIILAAISSYLFSAIIKVFFRYSKNTNYNHWRVIDSLVNGIGSLAVFYIFADYIDGYFTEFLHEHPIFKDIYAPSICVLFLGVPIIYLLLKKFHIMKKRYCFIDMFNSKNVDYDKVEDTLLLRIQINNYRNNVNEMSMDQKFEYFDKKYLDIKAYIANKLFFGAMIILVYVTNSINLAKEDNRAPLNLVTVVTTIMLILLLLYFVIKFYHSAVDRAVIYYKMKKKIKENNLTFQEYHARFHKKVFANSWQSKYYIINNTRKEKNKKEISDDEFICMIKKEASKEEKDFLSMIIDKMNEENTRFLDCINEYLSI